MPGLYFFCIFPRPVIIPKTGAAFLMSSFRVGGPPVAVRTLVRKCQCLKKTGKAAQRLINDLTTSWRCELFALYLLLPADHLSIDKFKKCESLDLKNFLLYKSKGKGVRLKCLHRNTFFYIRSRKNVVIHPEEEIITTFFAKNELRIYQFFY